MPACLSQAPKLADFTWDWEEPLRTIFNLAAIALVSFALIVPASAQRGDSALRGYEQLGTVTYAGRDNRVTFDVGRRAGRFAAFRLRARDARVEVRSAVVTFGNGERQRLSVRTTLNVGEASDAIELEGNRRAVRTVEVEIAPTIRRRQTGRIELLGTERAVAPPRVTFRLAGDRYMDTRTGSATIPLEANAGPVTHIQLVANTGSLNVSEIVVYANNRRERYKLDARLRAGSRRAQTDAIEISRRPIYVDRVEVTFAPTGERGYARLDVRGGIAEYALDRRRFNAAPRVDGSGDTQRFVLSGLADIVRGRARQDLDWSNASARVDRVAIRVGESPVWLQSVTMTYGNGQSDTFEVGRLLTAGTVSPAMVVGSRFIDKVSVEGFVIGRGDNARATLEAFADYNEDWLKEERRRDAWILLGAEAADSGRSGRLSVELPSAFGYYRALRVNVRNTGANVNALRVVYGNGQRENIRVRATLTQRRSQTGEIAATGGDAFKRRIRNVEVRYRARAGRRVAGRIELWGLRTDREPPRRRRPARRDTRAASSLYEQRFGRGAAGLTKGFPGRPGISGSCRKRNEIRVAIVRRGFEPVNVILERNTYSVAALDRRKRPYILEVDSCTGEVKKSTRVAR